ncbi:hypothetical protein DPMN_075550 [Dreissena polymorpha]|uniref:Uncharacterized protein n=1 Tax=Dreissena polymorpha TaxID=45954 RepID=A0A9D3YLA4_DREPO|nr:hypothetical protein DPMN_075550 [Dreissena polymorpha]
MYTGLGHQFYYIGSVSQFLPYICTGTHVHRTGSSVLLNWLGQSSLTSHLYGDSCIQNCAISSTILGGAVKSYLTSVKRLMYTGLCHQFYYTGWGSQVLPDVCRETHVYRTVPSVLLYWVGQSSLTSSL